MYKISVMNNNVLFIQLCDNTLRNNAIVVRANNKTFGQTLK